ncbi:hypothetical protein IIC38_09535 [candidate division KSB1 bacterium]|nr:hypothetical protein [candidate division KSB1 bacterium]
MKRLLLFAILISILAPSLMAQQRSPRWKRTEAPVKLDLRLFHSPHALNLPTAETLQKGDLEIEISHRFLPPLSEGFDQLYGIDGPINNRLAIGYAPSNRMVITIARSNTNDNLDFQIKHKTIQIYSQSLPTEIGLLGGIGWNMEVFDENGKRSRTDSKNFQFYGQMITNSLMNKHFGFGLVLSHLENSRFFGDETLSTTALGGYIGYFSFKRWNFIAEWNQTIDGYKVHSNSLAMGFELETGGHIFKILVGNSAAMNPSQYLAGADISPDLDNWRLGFMLTRLLKI